MIFTRKTDFTNLPLITCNLIMSLFFGEEDLLIFTYVILYIKESIIRNYSLGEVIKKVLERFTFFENKIKEYDNYVFNFIL